jgi:hypothetical protein
MAWVLQFKASTQRNSKMKQKNNVLPIFADNDEWFSATAHLN